MSIPPNSACRACAANFAQPVREEDVQAAQNLVDTVHHVNCVVRNPPLGGIRYRIGDHESDITRHLFRWDNRPYQEIFENGFRAIPQGGTATATYYDLYDYINNAGAPLDPTRPRRHVFISTTIDSGWFPQPNVETLPGGGQIEVYRYEIYAPGGIWVASTLRDQYKFASQAEVCFVGGIAPQYIRSAQLFTFTRSAYDPATQPVPHVKHQRADYTMIVNGHFNPLSDPSLELLLQMPLYYYLDENRKQRFLSHETYTPTARRPKRQVSNNNDAAPEPNIVPHDQGPQQQREGPGTWRVYSRKRKKGTREMNESIAPHDQGPQQQNASPRAWRVYSRKRKKGTMR